MDGRQFMQVLGSIQRSQGFVFDVAGLSSFSGNSTLHIHSLGSLNSQSCSDIPESLNPTLNFQVGNIGNLPIRSSCLTVRVN